MVKFIIKTAKPIQQVDDAKALVEYVETLPLPIEHIDIVAAKEIERVPELTPDEEDRAIAVEVGLMQIAAGQNAADRGRATEKEKLEAQLAFYQRLLKTRLAKSAIRKLNNQRRKQKHRSR